MTARRNPVGTGQAMEFEVWSDLIKQSKGALHVFLPLLDRGLDAVVHRMTDRRYIALQVKGRTARENGKVNLMVPADSLVEDRKSTRLNSSHVAISYAVFCLKKK